MRDTKEYLKQIQRIESMIESKMAEIAHLKSAAVNISPGYGGERVQASGKHDKIAETVVRYVDIEREIDSLVDLLVEKRREIISVIEEVTHPLQYAVLSKHYIQYKTFGQIAEEEHYSYWYILEIHGAAVKRVRDILQR